MQVLRTLQGKCAFHYAGDTRTPVTKPQETRSSGAAEWPPRGPHLVKDLQVEGVYTRGHCALDDLIPARVLGAVVGCGRLVHRVTQAQSAVRIHAGHAVVLCQLGLK